MEFASFRFWTGVLLLFDAGFGLLWSDRLAPVWPAVRLRRVLLVEICAALTILYLHFLVDPR